MPEKEEKHTTYIFTIIHPGTSYKYISHRSINHYVNMEVYTYTILYTVHDKNSDILVLPLSCHLIC